jgi:hypothetical protein
MVERKERATGGPRRAHLTPCHGSALLFMHRPLGGDVEAFHAGRRGALQFWPQNATAPSLGR